MGQLNNSKSFIFKAIILLLVLVPISVFVMHTDIEAVRNSLRRIGFGFIHIILVSFVAYLFGTWAWQVCLGKEKDKIKLFHLFAVRQIGETIGLYNPTSIVGGDLVKAEMLIPYGVTKQQALNAVATSRITAILSQILLFIIAFAWLIWSASGDKMVTFLGNFIYIVLTVLILTKLILFYWLSVSKIKTPPPIPVVTAGFWKRTHNQILHLLSDVRNFYRNHQRIFWQSYILFALHWVVGSLEFYIILQLLGFNTTIMHGLLLDMSVIIIKSAAAFVPGQLGIEEIGNKVMLGLIGVSGPGIWLTVSILRRARQLFWIAVGFICYLCIKKRPNHVATT